MEPTLALTKAKYEIEVSDFCGTRRDPTRWSAENVDRIRSYIESGLRRFYYCFPPHDWSFLRPFASLTLASGERTVSLPDDFGGVEGRVSISDASAGVFLPINFGNAAMIQEMYSATPSMTGRPQVASLRMLRAMSKESGQRAELFVFPEADAAYTLTFQYYMNPSYLLDHQMPYAYGGAEHSETIQESCLAVAEERRFNIATNAGPHGQAFTKLLLVSQALDRRKKPQWIGQNLDFSDQLELTCPRGLNSAAATVNGVEYS